MLDESGLLEYDKKLSRCI